MRALSLWQPHAQAIMLGIKPYETRGWSTDHRRPLAIHAAKKVFDYRDYPLDYYQEVAGDSKMPQLSLIRFGLWEGPLCCRSGRLRSHGAIAGQDRALRILGRLPG